MIFIICLAEFVEEPEKQSQVEDANRSNLVVAWLVLISVANRLACRPDLPDTPTPSGLTGRPEDIWPRDAP